VGDARADRFPQRTGSNQLHSLSVFSFAGNASVIHDDKEKGLRRTEKEIKCGMDNDRQIARERAPFSCTHARTHTSSPEEKRGRTVNPSRIFARDGKRRVQSRDKSGQENGGGNNIGFISRIDRERQGREIYNCAGCELIAKLIGLRVRALALLCPCHIGSRSKCEMGFECGRFTGRF